MSQRIRHARRKLTPAERLIIAHRGGWRCGGGRTVLPYPVCGELLPAAFEIDHVVPLSEGGDDGYLSENLVCLCPNDHANKTQREAIARGKRTARHVEVEEKYDEEEEEEKQDNSKGGQQEKSDERAIAPSTLCCACSRVISTYFPRCRCGAACAIQ